VGRTERMSGGTVTAGVRLRPTMLSDLDFVLSVEEDPTCRPFITPWERTQHEGAVRFPDFRHFVVEAGGGTQAVGFVILQGCRSRHRSVELKRMVIRTQGLGIGRACLRLLKQMAFRDLHARRLALGTPVGPHSANRSASIIATSTFRPASMHRPRKAWPTSRRPPCTGIEIWTCAAGMATESDHRRAGFAKFNCA
jgi:hypothetical protein